MSVQVPKGYKQTELGVIPEDWSVLRLKEISPSQSVGLVINPSTYVESNGVVPMLVGSNIEPNKINWIDARKISVQSNDSLPASRLRSGDIVVVRVGEPGISAVVPPEIDGCNCASVMIVRRHERFNSSWLSYLFNSPIGLQQIENVQYGTAQKQFNISDAINFIYPYPSLVEQQAIAEALSDADALIESLEQLIAKKRQIKQGAMQELLTGQRRLPGFSGEWVQQRLGEISHIKTGGRNNQDKIENGEFPFFVRSATVERINTFSYDCEAILVPGEGGIGSIFHYIFGKFDVHQRVYAITQFPENVSGKFIYYYMKNYFGRHAMENSVKATVDSLRLPTFQDFVVKIPCSVEEQIEIASILSEMEQELEMLEERLQKAKTIKQAMMQELLTGHIRLI